MAHDTHPGMKRPFCLRANNDPINSREVNEARGGLMLAAGHVRSKKKKNRRKKNTEKSAPPPKTHHEIHSSPATASNSRRHARKHVTHVGPYCPASNNPGFVDIGLVQLSLGKNNKCYTHTYRHTQTNEIMAPCTHPGMKSLFCLRQQKAPL